MNSLDGIIKNLSDPVHLMGFAIILFALILFYIAYKWKK